jgi:uncharacterized protein
MELFVNRDPGRAQLRPLIEIKAFRVACGEFISTSDLEKQELEIAGFAPLPDGVRFRKGMFAVRARGTSMQPRIDDGDWCIFVPDPGGTRNNRLVLVEDRNKSGVERYTLKRYRSKIDHRPDGTWVHSEITLWPLNALDHAPIPLDAHGNYDISGWFVGRVRQISRVEEYRYEYVFDEI